MGDLIAQWKRLLSAVPDARRRELARIITQKARSLGLAVVRPGGDVDIPVTLTPEIVEPAVVARRAADAARVLTAVIKAARAVLSPGVDGPWARKLFRHFGDFEIACLRNWSDAEDVTIARVDWFLDASGQHHALELNSTIPAMEAYSDAAARAWIETMAAWARMDSIAAGSLALENGSNSEDLRRSIVVHSKRSLNQRPSIAIIHREADAQLRELQALERAFRAAGHEVRLAVAETVALNSDGRAVIDAFVPDILYRHIFARRMPARSPIEKIALGLSRSTLQNPVNGQFEVKGLLAELARLVTEENGAGLDLTADETETIRNIVPWTRLLAAAPSLSPEGEQVPDLADFVATHPALLVLKRSWDYGGKSVLIGRDVLAAEGADVWRQRVAGALKDGDGSWVVQSLVASPRHRHLVVQGGDDAVWEDVFVDASTYTATGANAVPGGGVARFARTGVVNIVGGGGVAPLITASVAARIASALR